MDAGGGTSAQYQYLYGSTGDDTYVYSKENVYVYIGSAAEGAATGTADRVKFTDLSLKDVTLSNYLYTGTSAAEGNALNFTWGGGALFGQLRIALGAQHIERFEFADGTTLSSIAYDTASGISTLIGTAWQRHHQWRQRRRHHLWRAGQRRDERRRRRQRPLPVSLWRRRRRHVSLFEGQHLRLHRLDVRDVRQRRGGPGQIHRPVAEGPDALQLPLHRGFCCRGQRAQFHLERRRLDRPAAHRARRPAHRTLRVRRRDDAVGDQLQRGERLRGVDRHCRQRHDHCRRLARNSSMAALATTSSTPGACPAGSISTAKRATILMSTPSRAVTLCCSARRKAPRAAPTGLC